MQKGRQKISVESKSTKNKSRKIIVKNNFRRKKNLQNKIEKKMSKKIPGNYKKNLEIIKKLENYRERTKKNLN